MDPEILNANNSTTQRSAHANFAASDANDAGYLRQNSSNQKFRRNNGKKLNTGKEGANHGQTINGQRIKEEENKIDEGIGEEREIETANDNTKTDNKGSSFKNANNTISADSNNEKKKRNGQQRFKNAFDNSNGYKNNFNKV